MSTPQELVAAAYLVGYALSTAAVAVRLSFRWSDDALDRGFAVVLLGLAQTVGVPLLATALGVVNRDSVLVLHLALAVGVLAFVRPRGDNKPHIPARSPAGTIVALGAVAAFVSLSGLIAIAGPTQDFDTRNYHLPNMVHWLQGGSLWSFPFQYPDSWTGAHPGNGELLGLWLALPAHSDYLSLLSPILFAILGILAISVLARELGGRPWLGALGGLAVFAAPILFRSQTGSLATDTAAAASLAAAAALIARAVRSQESQWIVGAGLALGLALGSKYTAIVPGAALALSAAVLLRPWRRWLWLLPGVLLFFAPWLVRNALETGNPIFPQRIAIGGVELLQGSTNPLLAFDTPVAEHVVQGHWSVVGRWLGHVAWHVGPVILIAAVGVLAGFRRRVSPQFRALSLVALVAFLGYLVTPFTGGGPRGNSALLFLNIRYVEPALVIGVALAASLSGRVFIPLLCASLGFDAVRIAQLSLDRASPLNLTLREITLAIAVALTLTLIAAKIGSLGLLRPSRLSVIAIASLTLIATWGLAAAALHRSDRNYRPTAIEAMVDRARGPDRDVEVIGVPDLRSMLGRRLDVVLRAPDVRPKLTSGERPELIPGEPGQLDAALQYSTPWVLVVSAWRIRVPYQPPPEWCLFGRAGTESVYLYSPHLSGSGAREIPCR